MKNLILTPILLFLLCAVTNAQPRVVEKTFKVSKAATIDLDLRFGKHIKIEAWNKNEVSFQAVIEINSGRLNDALLLDYTQDEMGLSISADYDKERIKDGRRIDCPDRRYASYSWNDNGDHYVVCSEITYELMVPHQADLDIESISADIELSGVTGPVRAKSISGFVDVSWSEQQGADLSLKTISGEAYSNLENLMFRNKKDHPPLVGYELRGKIGKGGPLVRLESISGDIYLRRQ